MNFTFKIWRQHSADEAGKFVSYQVKDVTPDMSLANWYGVNVQRNVIVTPKQNNKFATHSLLPSV